MAGLNNGGRAEGYQALRESEELHRATLSSISDAVFLADDAGDFHYVCPNVDVIFGYVPDEVRSMSKLDRLLGENLYDPVELVAKGEICNIEREVTAKSGDRRIVLVQVKRVSIKGGTVLCTCRDVTELKLAERELTATRLNLTHAARLALVGQLMASIVHEIQQPLTAISLSASAGLRTARDQKQSAKTEKVVENLNAIRAASGSASEIIDRLRTLVRNKPLKLRSLDLNEAVNDVLSLVRADASRRGVVLRAELQDGLPPVEADRVSLQQVILNLITNAVDATEESAEDGVVIVRTRAITDAVEVAITDSGRGVAPEHRLKLFDAFFSTKPEGVGLGLAIAQSIAEAHKGAIRLDETDGRGATFALTLPLPARTTH